MEICKEAQALDKLLGVVETTEEISTLGGVPQIRFSFVQNS